MSKDIYTMLNGVNIDIDDCIKEDFDELKKKKLKKHFKKVINAKKNKNKKIVCAAALITSILICIVPNNAGASAFEKVSSMIGDNLTTLLGIDRNIDSYETVINKSVTDNGITVTLKEVILDDNELTVSYDVSSDKYLSNNNSWDGFDSISINGKELNCSSGGHSRNIDKHTTEAVITYNLGDCDLKGDLLIKLQSNTMMLMSDESKVSGKWKFEFKTNGDKLKIDTKKIKLNNTFTLENGQKYKIEKYTDNALGQKIYASIYNYSDKPAYDVCFKGTDDLGNPVEFSLSCSDKNKALFKICNLDANLNENAKLLILTPYAAAYPDNSGEMNSEYKKIGNEFIIDLSKLK